MDHFYPQAGAPAASSPSCSEPNGAITRDVVDARSLSPTSAYTFSRELGPWRDRAGDELGRWRAVMVGPAS